MDFFFDTSAVFKLYIQEERSDVYAALLQESPLIYVSSLSWVEFHSALRLRVAQKHLTLRDREEVLHRFTQDWKTFLQVELKESVVHQAAQFVTKHSLKALDAIQLASAVEVSEVLGDPVAFLTADRQLDSAARREKLSTLP